MARVTDKHRAWAERVHDLDSWLGLLPLSEHGLTTRDVLTLSIPLAHLVRFGIVTAYDVEDSDGLNPTTIAEVERYCRTAVEYGTRTHGAGWWTEAAERLGL